MKQKLLLTFLFTIILIPSFLFSQEVKNALLIANNNYIGKDYLSNPIPEARALKKALESIGFSITIVEDANRERMEDALFEFREKCKKEGGIAFFHYGGHAVQIDGVNYLLPANTKLDDITQVRFKCVNVNNLMDSMQGKANIVVLDSCRDNPFKSSTRGGATTRGLVGITKQPDNSIIIYSAKADKTARDGVFTPILTQYITEKNISIEDILKKVRREVLKKTDNEQTPGEYSQLTGSIYLAGNDGLSNKYNTTTRIDSKTLKGTLEVSAYTPASLYIDGVYMAKLTGSVQECFELPTGVHKIKLKYSDGNIEKKDVVIKANSTVTMVFKYTTLSYSSIYSVEANLGYSMQHFRTKHNEISFTANGFTLGLTMARFHFQSGFEAKIRTDYTFGFKEFGFEKIEEHNIILAGQLGYNYKWFAFHIGIALLSFQLENVGYPYFDDPIAQSSLSFDFRCNFPIDIEFKLINWLALYIEYSPSVALGGTTVNFAKHTLNLGIQFKIYTEYL